HGRCKLRPELAETALPLRIELPSVPCRGGVEVAERVFAPLGWAVHATALPLDPAFPEWGDSHYLRLGLSGTVRLADALSHLYVLLPVLDGAKHYWLAADEVDKLIRAGGGWLAEHPERAWITRRYLARRQSLVRTALARLAELEEVEPERLDAVEEVDEGDGPNETLSAADGAEGDGEAGPVERAHPGAELGSGPAEVTAAGGSETDQNTQSLAVLRRAAVRSALHELGARRVLDLGCGEGALLRELLADSAFSEIVGVDVSMRALHIAERKLRLDRLPERVARRLTLRQGALTYTDARLRGYDAAVLMEVVEHVDPPRLGALEHAVFAAAAPGAVIVTTPNAEYNARYESLAAGTFRHADHRFEWIRAEFAAWADGVAARHGYAVRFVPIGEPDAELGAPTQLALFTKINLGATASAREGAA
ncbi:methyltransferase, partial [Nocardia tenerifensis]